MKHGMIIIPLETTSSLHFKDKKEKTVDKMGFGNTRSGFFPNTVQDWYPPAVVFLNVNDLNGNDCYPHRLKSELPTEQIDN
jgi:hypothetical protein